MVGISCILLVGLFSIQHHGTHRVAFLFAPIVTAWLLSIAGIGIYNIIQWNPQIFHALSPVYMVKLLKRTRREGWLSLGGVVLSITGVETMFADLGHFSTLSVKVIVQKYQTLFIINLMIFKAREFSYFRLHSRFLCILAWFLRIWVRLRFCQGIMKISREAFIKQYLVRI